MEIAAKIGRKSIRLVHWFIDLFILIIIFLLIAFSCYAIWDSGQVHNIASHRQYEMYKPTVAGDTTSFEDLQTINPDVFAWLTVYGTNIDYPVVQGQDNKIYVNTNARGRHALSGAIFLDFRSAPDFSDFNSILYGHHMENRVMFGEIALFSDRGYFEARRYGMLYFDGKEHGLEFFAFVHTDAYDTTVFKTAITEPDEQQAYLDLLLQTAVHTRNYVPVTVSDRIVLLSTCSPNSTNGRDILIGRIIAEVHDDPFFVDTPVSTPIIPVIDEISGLWTQLDMWARISIAAVISLLILLLIISIIKRRKRR
ncbi:MAG: class B sortase [Oscillospiraceae bacterium]|nr:class B sortase [Oscillospiraceae bacterium]